MKTHSYGRMAARILIGGALLVGVAACGDDEDDDAATGVPAGEAEQAAGGDNDAFCDAVVAFNSKVPTIDLDDSSSEADIQATGDELIPLWDDIRENPPEAVEAEVDELSTAIDGLAEGDATAFNEEATFETYTAMIGKAVPECDFESVDVEAVDYAFEGVPDTVAPGTYALELTNSSEDEPHEMVLFKKNDPEADIQDLLALPEEEAQEQVTFVGATFAEPGGSSASLIELEEGAYAMVCFIPVGGGEGGPPHFTEGMLAELTVE